MVQSKPTDTTTFWQAHVAAWQASGLTRKAYCQEQALQYSAFGYWARKLRSQGNDRQATTPGFVPVTLAPAEGSLVLTLPNGLEIRGIEAGNLLLVKALLEALR